MVKKIFHYSGCRCYGNDDIVAIEPMADKKYFLVSREYFSQKVSVLIKIFNGANIDREGKVV